MIAKRRKAFTMLEMVAVVIIIAFLATMAVQQVSGNIFLSRVDAAKAELRNIGNAIEIFAINDANAKFPDTLRELETVGLIRFTKKDGSGNPLDPWGQQWQYCKPDRTTDTNGAVWSVGPNGKGTMEGCPGANPHPTAGSDTAQYGLYYVIKVKP